MNSNKQNLINKIRYRAQYRGTKEMDIFVNEFVNSIIDKLDIEQLKDLDDLVNLDDEKLINLANQTNIKEENKVVYELKLFKKIISGGETGFEPRKELPLCQFFKTGAFNRSAISP